MGYRPIAGMTAVLLMLAAAPASAAEPDILAPTPGRLFVAPEGRDSWSGRQPTPLPDGTDGPLATIPRALALLRPTGPSPARSRRDIVLRAGTFLLPAPVQIGAADSGTRDVPLRIRAYPGETPILTVPPSAPALANLFALRGPVPPLPRDTLPEAKTLHHVILDGLAIRHTRLPDSVPPHAGAIWLEGARDCEVRNCRFDSPATYAVVVGDGALRTRLRRNTVAAATAGAFLLTGRSAVPSAQSDLIGNRLLGSGRNAIVLEGSTLNRIAYNTVVDSAGSGLSLVPGPMNLFPRNNVIEYNRILRCGIRSSTAAGIEMRGTPHTTDQSGTVIRFNLVMDTSTAEPTGKSWGIQLSHVRGARLVGNILVRAMTSAVALQHCQQIQVDGNILVNGGNHHLDVTGDDAARIRITRNIIGFSGGTILRVEPWRAEALALCDRNLYWRYGRRISASADRLFPTGSLLDWQSAGHDRTSRVADPLFICTATDDYRLMPKSPAHLLNVRPIHPAEIGARGDRGP